MVEQTRPNRVLRLTALALAAGLLLLVIWNVIELFQEDWIAALVVLVVLSAWELLDFWRARRHGLPYP